MNEILELYHLSFYIIEPTLLTIRRPQQLHLKIGEFYSQPFVKSVFR